LAIDVPDADLCIASTMADVGCPVRCADLSDGRMQLRRSSYRWLGPTNVANHLEEVLLPGDCQHGEIRLWWKWSILYAARWRCKHRYQL